MEQKEGWERLLDELRSEFLLREEELSLLHDIDLRLLENDRPPDETFQFIVRKTKALLKCDHAHILIRSGSTIETAYSTGAHDKGQRFSVTESYTGVCYLEGTIQNIDLTSLSAHDHYVEIDGYAGPTMKSALAVPIRIRDHTLGVLNVESSQPTAFDEVHERILVAIASQLAMAFQRVQLFDRAALFADVDQLLFSESESQQVVQVALERVMLELRRLENVNMAGAQLLFRRGSDELIIVNSTAPGDVGMLVPTSGSISGRAVLERRTVVVGDVASDPQYRRMLGATIQSEIAVPIMIGDDHVVLGVLNVESEELDAFNGMYQVVLESFAEKVKILLAITKLRTDVTEALEMRQADDLLVAVGDQTTNILHRINNTAGALRFLIMDTISSLADGTELSREALSTLLEEFLNLINRTLEAPQELAHSLNPESLTVSVNESVEKALRTIAVPSTVTVEKALESNIPRLALYCFDIVVQNLIQNGIDAMPRGGTLTIATSVHQHPQLPTGYVILSVADTGQGIPADILGQVFNLNFTTKRDKGSGLGLGLWWVRNFILRSRGEITLTSEVDKGSEVLVKLPFDKSSPLVASNG